VSAEAAARLGDEIAHGFGLAAMIAGAVIGVVAGVAVVSAMALTGGLAAVVIAGAVAGGGFAMAQLASAVQTIFNLPEPTSGILAMGSPNVLTNMRPAARAVLDFAAGCSGLPFNHFPMAAPVPLAEGSSTVLINGMPASRLKSMLVCGAHVKSASPDVVIGGETARMIPVFDLEGWFQTGLEILGLGAMIAGGLFAAAAGFAAAGLAGGIAYVVGYAVTVKGIGLGFEGLGLLGNALGPGYGDLFQGVAGMGLLLAGPKLARGGRSGSADGGPLGQANFAQKTFKATFSEEGRFGGRRVSDVAADIRAGRISPSEVPLDYIVRDGKPIILNTRSAQALEQAGVPRGQWNGINRTGSPFHEELLNGQLTRNKLGPEGIPTVRPGSGH
jgi:uncharacterized Zn-binding protein involved in type VI secretion